MARLIKRRWALWELLFKKRWALWALLFKKRWEIVIKKKTDQYQTSYNTTNMNNWNTNFDNTYNGEVKNNNYTNFADWNKSSLLLEEEYYKDTPNACNSI